MRDHDIVDVDVLSTLDRRFHLHSQTNFRRLQSDGPLIIQKGDGPFVVDSNKGRYLEGMSGLWCASLGFSDERLVAAAERQLKALPYYHTFNQRTPDITTRLASKIAEVSPIPGSKVFFATSGSEANESMIKIAWAYHLANGMPKRRKILSHVGGFHGSTIFAASVAGLPNMHKAFGLPLEGIIHLRAPFYSQERASDETISEFRDRLLRDLEDTILREGPESIAAFISEPVLAAGGVIIPPDGYFNGVQSILRKYGILMLSDEIVCGFGRTGEWFGHQSMGFAPDMMSCGKSLTAGYQPLSCVVVGGHLYNSLEEQTAKLNGFGHGFTYSGHPVSAAVALEAVSIYQQMNVSSHVKDRAMVLAKSLETHCIHEQIYEIRQIGLMAAIQLTSVKGHYSPHTDVHIGVELDRAARRHGLIVRIIGNSTIAICPPYIVSDSQIDFISKKISASLNDVLGVG